MSVGLAWREGKKYFTRKPKISGKVRFLLVQNCFSYYHWTSFQRLRTLRFTQIIAAVDFQERFKNGCNIVGIFIDGWLLLRSN